MNDFVSAGSKTVSRWSTPSGSRFIGSSDREVAHSVVLNSPRFFRRILGDMQRAGRVKYVDRIPVAEEMQEVAQSILRARKIEYGSATQILDIHSSLWDFVSNDFRLYMYQKYGVNPSDMKRAQSSLLAEYDEFNFSFGSIRVVRSDQLFCPIDGITWMPDLLDIRTGGGLFFISNPELHYIWLARDPAENLDRFFAGC